jgi:4-amino-4-deoxy-L-arabinose transferase-like glycosyltransferase
VPPVLLACFLFLFQLDHGSLIDFDESITAVRISEMAETGDYLTVHDNFRPSFHKPPLYYWLSQPIIRLFGLNEFSVRFVSALAGIICVLLTAAIARKVCGSNIGILAGYVLATNWFFIRYSRQALLDSTMILFALCTIYCCIQFLTRDQSGKWLITAFISAALGTLAKGPVAFALTFPIACLACVMEVSNKKSFMLHCMTGLVIFLLVALPWHMHQLFTHGKVFLLEYLQMRHVSSMPVSIGGTIMGVYGKDIFQLGPVIILAAFAGILFSILEVRKKVAAHLIVLSYFAMVFSILIFYPTRRSVYLTPLVPPLSIYAIYALHRLTVISPLNKKIWLIIFLFLHLTFFAYLSNQDFLDKNIYKRELAETARLICKKKCGLLIAYDNVYIPSLIYYSQIRTINVSDMNELKRISEEYNPLPVILPLHDARLFQEVFPQSRYVKDNGPYSLWVLGDNDT